MSVESMRVTVTCQACGSRHDCNAWNGDSIRVGHDQAVCQRVREGKLRPSHTTIALTFTPKRPTF